MSINISLQTNRGPHEDKTPKQPVRLRPLELVQHIPADFLRRIGSIMNVRNAVEGQPDEDGKRRAAEEKSKKPPK